MRPSVIYYCFETYMGVPAAGLVVVPLNTRQAMAELKYSLEDSQSKVLLTDRDPGELADCVDHADANRQCHAN